MRATVACVCDDRCTGASMNVQLQYGEVAAERKLLAAVTVAFGPYDQIDHGGNCRP